MDRLERALVECVRADAAFMRRLDAVRRLALPEGCIGAGAVRSLVWDALDGNDVPSRSADVDVAYFDASDVTPDRDRVLVARLAWHAPDVPWEVTNQAGVHHWFEARFGHPVEPLRSLAEAVASWPEYATCVAVRLTADDRLQVIAPHGLDDLFSMTVRRNPARVSVATYRQRIATKCYAARWPRVRVIDSP